ncbi:tRNA (adenosine(37)-N6)-threonylcarbamoyltransferase complex dimerization subunit type 1 TsaB [Nitrosovibrio sp. Nv17]|uniref:tRNA (adenosine(37)-N6)-threonylcarbamoyltransferase complex dimerization subunit type 1 TsaB n=1 Tax=Nitrosovibrio sp. Nv17 TaxID=1855339 RepID=UPI000931ED7A|nr:tRNA (adenosine(37)-N6)-threonylcarbamoyltransferase complex dimerization subunit type 1 TsaB [Nitrosovibrio sp. Nv17]
MRILAFDTSTEYCSVAVLTGDACVHREVLAQQRHSELILPMARCLLDEAGLALAQLDGIAFGAGPGSFTGLRIACGVAQGMALGAGLPVAGIGTLEALAEAAGGDRVVASLDARMGEIYHAAYERTLDGWQPVSAPVLCAPQQAPRMEGSGWTGCGSGFAVYGEALRARHAGRIDRILPGIRPHAREVARLAKAAFECGRGMDPAGAVPFYVRDKVALKERER